MACNYCKKTMWALVGSSYCFYGDECCSGEKVVALFDTEEAARKYEKAARLKNPVMFKKYRDKSVLSSYEHVIVTTHLYPDEPIQNPEINW